MSSFVIEGGYRLSGEIVPQGAKNEALEVICATLLTPEKVTIHNVPDILDVNNLIQLLRDMRVKVEHPSADTYTFQADDVDMEYLSTEEFLRKSGSLRGSVMIVGPLVARFGRALIPKPGGDKIGRRRLDTHFVGIQKLGACFSYDAGRQVYEIEARQLKGAYMLLDADMIIHVVDCSNDDYERHMATVYETLKQLDVGDKPIITLFNKCDKYGELPILKDSKADYVENISARTGVGIDEFLEDVQDIILKSRIRIERVFPYSDAGKIQLIREYGQLESEEYTQEGISVKGYVPAWVGGKL